MQQCSPCVPLSKVSTFKPKMKSSSNGLSAFKHSTLNPNAAEFVPSTYRTSSVITNSTDFARSETADPNGKAVLKRSESCTSNTSDDESKQYWRYRLPDDITPDFGQDVIQESDSAFSANINGFEQSHSSTAAGHLVQAFEKLSPTIDANNVKARYPFSQSAQGGSTLGLSSLTFNNGWESLIGGEQQLVKSGEGYVNNDDCDVGYLNDLVGEQALSDNGDFNPVEHLSAKFPGYASDSLASVYDAFGGDLTLTTEILTKLELQDGAGSQQPFTSRASSTPNLTSVDFPALSNSDALNGLSQFSGDELQGINTYRRGEGNDLMFVGSNITNNSRFAADFAAVVRKSASDTSQWKHEKNGDANFGSNRNTQGSAGSFGSNSRMINGDRVLSYSSVRQTSTPWLETGDSVATMYSTMREEARDHARIRNAYFEQARSAFLAGNKALAKELSRKGQLHNSLMKAAHGKAGEAIYRQRNLATTHFQNYSQGQDRMIDLHGLHVTEAIRVLRTELAVLRNTARSTGQMQQVLICVGTGHHTKGARTPARLPIAVEKYLLEEEHLTYSELQPGMLCVAIF